MTRAEVEKLVPQAIRDNPTVKCIVVAVRGYYEDSMGKPDVNDRNLYDDAMFVLTPDDFRSFNANTDPSAWRKGIASLCLGVHWYKPGNHGISRPGGGYPAFRPATPNEQLPVTRDGVVNPRPGVAINIHKGSKNSTSSEGCQTLYPAQWAEFHKVVMLALSKGKMGKFPYVLVEA